MKEEKTAIVTIKIQAKIQYGPGRLTRILKIIKTLGFNIRKSKTYLSPIKGNFISKIVLEAKNYSALTKKLEAVADILEKESKWIDHATE